MTGGTERLRSPAVSRSRFSSVGAAAAEAVEPTNSLVADRHHADAAIREAARVSDAALGREIQFLGRKQFITARPWPLTVPPEMPLILG